MKQAIGLHKYIFGSKGFFYKKREGTKQKRFGQMIEIFQNGSSRNKELAKFETKMHFLSVAAVGQKRHVFFLRSFSVLRNSHILVSTFLPPIFQETTHQYITSTADCSLNQPFWLIVFHAFSSRHCNPQSAKHVVKTKKGKWVGKVNSKIGVKRVQFPYLLLGYRVT